MLLSDEGSHVLCAGPDDDVKMDVQLWRGHINNEGCWVQRTYPDDELHGLGYSASDSVSRPFILRVEYVHGWRREWAACRGLSGCGTTSGVHGQVRSMSSNFCHGASILL